MSFTTYLREKKLLTDDQCELLPQASRDGLPKTVLYFMYMQNMSLEQAEAAILSKAAEDTGEDDIPEALLQANAVLAAGFMDATHLYTELIDYKFSTYLTDNLIYLKESSLTYAFVCEYISLFITGLRTMTGVEHLYHNFNVEEKLPCKHVVYQTIYDEPQHLNIITGISTDLDTMRKISQDFYETRTPNREAPLEDEPKEDTIDFFCELLNNINGSCTYRFNIGFDLDLPLYLENTSLTASQILTFDFDYEPYQFTLFIITGQDYDFK